MSAQTELPAELRHREIAEEREFWKTGDFYSYYAAEAWLRENGFSRGSMQHPAPTAVFRGDCDISKWRNLSRDERRSCDGLMTGDFRNGPVKVVIFKS